jgi:hypothetical protein
VGNERLLTLHGVTAILAGSTSPICNIVVPDKSDLDAYVPISRLSAFLTWFVLFGYIAINWIGYVARFKQARCRDYLNPSDLLSRSPVLPGEKVLTGLRTFVNSDQLTSLTSTGIGTETSQFRKLALGSLANSR